MENVRKFLDAAVAWQEEKNEDRAIVIIAIECAERDENGFIDSVNTSSTTVGRVDVCTQGIKGVLSDPDNMTAKALNKAAQELVIEKSMEL